MEMYCKSGINNPADCITRPVSRKVLSRTNYYCGPNYEQFEETKVQEEVLRFRLPSRPVQEFGVSVTQAAENLVTDHLVPVDRFSNLTKIVKVHAKVLMVCYDMSVSEFLRAFMIHLFEFGLPQLVISDLGTQIVAAGNKITDFLNDPETDEYFKENGINKIKFEGYFKRCSSLGSLVETSVKMTKQMINKSIRTNILEVRDFEFLICQVRSLINNRPIAFKESLRDQDLHALSPITPEMLLRGYEIVTVNLIPELQPLPELDEYSDHTSPSDLLKDKYTKIRNVRHRLFDLYQSEFMSTLLSQAIDTKDRYKPCKHDKIGVGDIVLIKDANVKPVNFPMGIVKQIITNNEGETTGAELTKRHVSCLIPLLLFVIVI
ncbi:uncharacterized protein [Palaemon carinicauda]|uniref:uncharacterized protein n=1 Tax=Palaemon carinicauda TaxID=392227 RepID=UPI0035B5C019